MTAAKPESVDYNRARLVAAAAIAGCLIASVFLLPLVANPDPFTLRLLVNQDLWLAPVLMLGCLIKLAPAGPGASRDWNFSGRAVWMSLVAVLLVCWLGHYLVFENFEISRDEQMVAFDADIFARGALVWPIPPDWQHLANALNRKFMLPIGAAEAWVSGYLPVNAALHALVGLMGDDDLTAPLLVAAGGGFLWKITGMVWPDSRTARLATLAFYVGSSQILITGMTKFAMSGHLALNLCWLWLFLRDRGGSHAAAMIVGFLATGLHQPLFHPLFVLPFFALMAVQKRWRLLAAYLFAYACISLFWLAWPLWIASFGTGPLIPIKTTPISYFDRLAAAIKVADLASIWMMAANLLRFAVWQHPLLLPFAIFGAWAGWRRDRLVTALAAGFILPILVMWILLPWQGGGWGYRYVHPVMGNAVLLGGWGVYWAQQKFHLSVRRPLLWTTAFAVFVLLPIHGFQANRVAAPLAAKDKAYSALDADLLLVDERILDDFVHNRPDLSNRPVRLISRGVRPQDLQALCVGRSVIFLDPALPVPPSVTQQRLKAAALASGCDARQVREPWRT